jgi:uncharacterized protein YyaL (SSP411 family)
MAMPASLVQSRILVQDPAGSSTSPDDRANDRRDAPEQGAPHKYTNKLISETSPYLLMHAHNPVNWYAWGDEALHLAKKENKIIFLSIGYSSCHWCHVMERESFLDEEIAKFLNDRFICIKVDREERPDVDEIYMEALRVVNPRVGGGWPLSMFLTPDAEPFFGGTYIPARDGDRGMKMGFLSVIEQVDRIWKSDESRIRKDGAVATDITRRRLTGTKLPADAEPQRNWITRCLNGLRAEFDPEYGGFRYSQDEPDLPKFPEPANLLFLIDQARRNPADKEPLAMVEKSCERMMVGGIQDHLGGGFHRYSVDRFWAVPHFEKMLYDNGQLASVFSEAYELTGRKEFARVVDELLEFVLRELTHEEGAFFAALDAESGGEEGKYYVWHKNDIRGLLTDEEFELVTAVYGLDQQPNFENDAYVLQLRHGWNETADGIGKSLDQLWSELDPIRKKLLKHRDHRPRPLLDNKILTSWNGLMIRGFADAGRILKNRKYADAAARAADFILQNMTGPDGRLFRTHTNGQARLNAYDEDYACLIDGLIALHKADDKPKWLEAAEQIQKKQIELFWDEKTGGFFYTSNDHETLLTRAKRPTDGAIPSGNSVATGNLLYLGKALGNDDYRNRARLTAIASTPTVEQFPIAAPRLLISVASLLDETEQQE